MRTIHKYTLEWQTQQEVKVPFGAQLLSVAEQREKIVAYFLVETDNTREDTYEFRVYGTGENIRHQLPENSRFVGTVNIHNGSWMLHVFAERVE